MSEQIDFVGVLQFIERLSMLRVYGQLANSPALYWENNEDPDSLYLKNQRAWVSRYMGEYLGEGDGFLGLCAPGRAQDRV